MTAGRSVSCSESVVRAPDFPSSVDERKQPEEVVEVLLHAVEEQAVRVEDSYDAGLSAVYFDAHERHEAPPDARGDLRLVRALGTDLWDAGIEGEDLYGGKRGPQRSRLVPLEEKRKGF